MSIGEKGLKIIEKIKNWKIKTVKSEKEFNKKCIKDRKGKIMR